MLRSYAFNSVIEAYHNLHTGPIIRIQSVYTVLSQQFHMLFVRIYLSKLNLFSASSCEGVEGNGAAVLTSSGPVLNINDKGDRCITILYNQLREA